MKPLDTDAILEGRPISPETVDWLRWYAREAVFSEPEVFCADCPARTIGSRRTACCRVPVYGEPPRRSLWRRLISLIRKEP